MARGRIRIPAIPRTELPMTISTCFFPIDIVKKRSMPDAAKTINSPLVIATHCCHTVGLILYPGHLYALLIVLSKFPVF